MQKKPPRTNRTIEIIKCREGKREYLKERRPRGSLGKLKLVCFYPLDPPEPGEPSEAAVVWRLAKRAARDFLRVSAVPSAIVKQSPDAIGVFWIEG